AHPPRGARTHPHRRERHGAGVRTVRAVPHPRWRRGLRAHHRPAHRWRGDGVPGHQHPRAAGAPPVSTQPRPVNRRARTARIVIAALTLAVLGLLAVVVRLSWPATYPEAPWAELPPEEAGAPWTSSDDTYRAPESDRLDGWHALNTAMREKDREAFLAFASGEAAELPEEGAEAPWTESDATDQAEESDRRDGWHALNPAMREKDREAFLAFASGEAEEQMARGWDNTSRIGWDTAYMLPAGGHSE